MHHLSSDAAGNVIETHEHAGEFKEWQVPKMVATAVQSAILKRTLLQIVAMEPQDPNIYVVRSVWRRLKKGHIAKVCRDLEPGKDVKGGGVTGKSRPTAGSTGTTGNK